MQTRTLALVQSQVRTQARTRCLSLLGLAGLVQPVGCVRALRLECSTALLPAGPAIFQPNRLINRTTQVIIACVLLLHLPPLPPALRTGCPPRPTPSRPPSPQPRPQRERRGPPTAPEMASTVVVVLLLVMAVVWAPAAAPCTSRCCPYTPRCRQSSR